MSGEHCAGVCGGGGFPNVFDPEWERMCERVASEMCAIEKNDRDLVGYFIDNELAWWGDGAFDLACGLYDCAAKLPKDHSARQALDRYIGGLGTSRPTGEDGIGRRADGLVGRVVPNAPQDVSADVKVGFLRIAAERYFSVAAAIRRAWRKG